MIGHVFLLFFKPIDYQTLNTITPATPTTTFGNRPRLDIATLQGAVCRYPGNGITLTTKRMYASGITRERERGERWRERERRDQEYNTKYISAHKHNVYQYLPLKTPSYYVWLTWPCNNYHTHYSRSMYQPYTIYMLPVETIITSPHNRLITSKWSSMASKESKL